MKDLIKKYILLTSRIDLENTNYYNNLIIEPLFDVIPLKLDHLNFRNIKSIIITSNNAIFSLKSLNVSKNCLILAVGAKTASRIKGLGYNNVCFAKNSASSLLNLARKKININHESLYLSGQIITLDIAKELRKDNFKCKKVVVYSIKEKSNLSSRLITKIMNNQICRIFFYSQNTVKIFYKLIVKHNLENHYREVETKCMSQKIIECCKNLGFVRATLISKTFFKKNMNKT